MERKWLGLGLAAVICAGGCEFSFGQKTEPMLKAVADPGVTVATPHTPEILSARMTEDLSDRGWRKADTIVRTTAEETAGFLAERGLAACVGSIPVAVITEIPYVKDNTPATSITLAFVDLGQPINAYAAFTGLLQEPFKEYIINERESLIRGNTALFWEGPFLVTVTAGNLGEDTRDVLLGVSKGVIFKLYGLIGTYSTPTAVRLVPSYQMVPNSLRVLNTAPFPFGGPALCLESRYTTDAGAQTLWSFTDPSPAVIADFRNRLVVHLLGEAGAGILASSRDAAGTSTIWINTPAMGVVEIACQRTVVAVQPRLTAYLPDLPPVPGFREMATAPVVHTTYAPGVTINPYAGLVTISRPGAASPTIILRGMTDAVLRSMP